MRGMGEPCLVEPKGGSVSTFRRRMAGRATGWAALPLSARDGLDKLPLGQEFRD